MIGSMMKALLGVVVLLVVAAGASAEIYKCKGSNGKLVFSDRKCATDAEGVDVRGEFEAASEEAAQSGLRRGEQEMLSDYYKRRERLRKAAAERAERAQQRMRFNRAIEDGKIMVGMTEEDVLEAWGRPTKVNTSLNASGRREQWVYRHTTSSTQYVYFQNGVMTGTN